MPVDFVDEVDRLDDEGIRDMLSTKAIP